VDLAVTALFSRLPVVCFIAVWALVAFVAGCRRSTPPQSRVQKSELPRIAIKADSKLLLTYYKGTAAAGSFQTVTSIKQVPEFSRAWVRVVDLSLPPARRRDHELVYVADLRKPRKNGQYPYVVLSRDAFESSAKNKATYQAKAAAKASGVVLYSTSWCSACRAAKRWLNAKGIAFIEKDIEKDRSAAAELMSKAQQAGISASGVPVIDVKGTLVQGFDARRIAKLLEVKK
jgi:glutaredoxin